MRDPMNFRPIMNFRDLGGLVAADGRLVKRGLLYRAAGLYWLTEEERERFDSLGIRAVLDLRTKREATEKPDPVFTGVDMLQHSGLEFRGGKDIDFSPAGMHRLGEGGREQLRLIRNYYKEMPFDNEAFRILVAEVERGKVPLVFHCASGKDRTGVAAMVLLLALGIPEETVLADYLESNEYLAEDIAAAEAEHASAMAEDPAHMTLIRMEAGVDEAMGRDVLAEIKKRCGSYENYLDEEFDLRGRRLRAFRDCLLEERV